MNSCFSGNNTTIATIVGGERRVESIAVAAALGRQAILAKLYKWTSSWIRKDFNRMQREHPQP